MPTQAEIIAGALRAVAPRGKLLAEDVPIVNQLATLWAQRLVDDPAGGVGGAAVLDPRWVVEARKMIGQREIPGPSDNSWISQGWAKLGAGWFNDDETPWCGFFVAYCLSAAGLPYPGKGEFARALRWASWGVASAPRLGAIGVKSRQGGGHVFFIVGETPDRRFFKALGGNQGNMVSIVDIAKSAVTAIRWPEGTPAANPIALPVMPAGTVNASEA